jgi:predicted MFS family arabinose efflux permease
MGTFTAAIMVSTVLLTFIGGSLTGINWRFAFVLIPVVAAILFFLVPVVLPKQDRITGTNTDLLGQLLLAAGVIAFLYSLSQFATSLTSPKTLVPLVAGVLLLAGFFIWESKSEHNFFPVGLFRSPIFLAALAAGLIYNFGTAVAFLQVTNLWQYITGLKTSEVAVWQLPMLLAGIASGVIIGRLMVKGLSNRSAIVIGGFATIAGFIALALAHSSKDFLAFLPGLVLGGGGVVIAAVPFGNLILRESPPRYLGPV